MIFMHSKSIPVIVAAIALLAGCTQLEPYHTQLDPIDGPRRDCAPDETSNKVPKECRAQIVEHARFLDQPNLHEPGYDLYFAEFDDQGWPYAAPKYGRAGDQIDIFIDGLERALAENPENGVSVVVYVHGWKHNADSDDDNVVRFRQVLRSLSHIERESTCQRKMIGLYVGWRGASISNSSYSPEVIQDITFWDRKSTASAVAQGSVRELFARLHSLQGAATPPPSNPPKSNCVEHPLRSLIVGHSFGGLIVFEVLSEALIRDVADYQQERLGELPADKSETKTQHTRKPRYFARNRTPRLPRESDLILIINPAVEASRYDALARAIDPKQHEYKNYRAPIFISLTSTDDWATRIAFPIGRTFSTMWHRYTPELADIQKDADTKTIGQDTHFLTMRLETISQHKPPIPPDTDCKDYPPFDIRLGLTPPKTLKQQLKMEQDNFQHFVSDLDSNNGSATSLYPRHFCGQEELLLSLYPDGTHTESEANSPLWNITTQSPIVKDHGDISNPFVLQFARQIYLETDNPRMKIYRELQNSK